MQEEFIGFGTLEKLEDVVERAGTKSIFLVTGGNSYALSGARERIKTIQDDIPHVRFIATQNPDIEIIKEGTQVFRNANPDMVVAVGGGSVLDTAKSVNVLAAQEGKPEDYVRGKPLTRKGPHLIAIPTTSGTGSEATHFATIYIKKEKYSLADRESMFPDVSIVDPTLTETLPPYITACTGLDALCQGIESLWSINSTKRSREWATRAIELAYGNIEQAVNNPNRDARLSMALASNYSGKAINISKTTAPHSVSYPMTSYYSVPHGHAVSLTTPSFIEFNALVNDENCNDKRGARFVREKLETLFEILDCNGPPTAKKRLEDLMAKIGVATRLNDVGIDEKGIQLVTRKGFAPDRMGNNPREVTREDLTSILERIA